MSSSGTQPGGSRAISYKEVDENEDLSDGELFLLDDDRSKKLVKEKFGDWTVKLDLSQKWEKDIGRRTHRCLSLGLT